MSTEHVRNFVHLLEECHTRIQTLGELLLISCKPRPIFTSAHDLELTNENFVRFRDRVISHLNKMCILSKDISSQIHADGVIQVEKQLNQPLVSLSSTMVALTQLCGHMAYLMAIHTEGSHPASLGPVASQFDLVQADLELKFVCGRLKRSHVHDINPHQLVDMCTTITKSLSCIADICKDAADRITDTQEQDQFKLCIKAITSTTGCLVSSVKTLKSRRQHHHQPHNTTSGGSSDGSTVTTTTASSNDSDHLQRVVNFCLPVTATSTALTAFALEDKFLGSPASLSPQGENLFKSILGLCMSMLSASVQTIKASRDLLHDPGKRKHKDRISLCVDSISRTAFRLRDFLLSYEFSFGCVNATSGTTSTTTGSTLATLGGDDKHLAVIKDGEILTPFHSIKKDKSSSSNNVKEKEEKQILPSSPLSSSTSSSLKRDKHRHNDSSGRMNMNVTSDKKCNSTTSQSTLLSPSSVLGSAISDASSSKLPSASSSLSPSTSPKLHSKSSQSSPKLSSKSSSTSDSKKKHHRKSSSKHSVDVGSSHLSGKQPNPSHPTTDLSSSISSSPSLQPVVISSVSSHSVDTTTNITSPPISPTPLYGSSPPSASAPVPTHQATSSSSVATLDPSSENMKDELMLSMDVLSVIQSERL